MADVYKGLTVEIGADTSKLSTELRKARRETGSVTTDLKKLERALKIDPGNTRLLAQQQEDYKKAISSTAKELELLKKAEAAALDGSQPLNDEQWKKLQSDIAMAEIKLKGYKQALADTVIQQGVANSALGKFGAGLESFGGKIKPAGQMVESMGGKLTRTLTPAIIGAGAATVAAAVDIDSSLTNVKKTVDGTDAQYQHLKQSAIEFSQTNAVSASQILDIQSLGAQLGFAIDELDEFGRVVSGLDIATNMNAEQAATEMAQFANITKMSHGDISNYGSAIVGLGNSFATTESDISSMAMRIAAAGTQVGMSQADILGLATALSSMGVEAEAGGTAVSTIMAQIDKDIATNSASVETWASTAGMSAQQFADAWKNDPVTALSALLSNMESATAEGGNMSVMLETLGVDSIRQTDIMKRLAGNSSLVADAVAKSNDEWAENSALQSEVDNRNASLASQFEILKNRVIAMADQVGGPLAAALLDVIDAAEPLIQLIADGAKQFSEMSKSEQQAVLKAVALSAALGPMLSVFGKGMQQVEGFGKGLQKLAKFFATVDFKTSDAGRSLKTFTGETTKSEAAVKKQTTAVKASSVAMGAAKAALLGLALAGIAVVIQHMVKAHEEAETLKRATDGLRDSAKSFGDAYAGTVDPIDASKSAIESMTEKVKSSAKEQAELASSIEEVFDKLGADTSLVDEYMRTIEELGGKSGLTKDEQNDLAIAVAGVNELCGTTYSIIDSQNGVLSDSTAVIKDNTEAWKNNAIAQASQSKMIELQERKIELDNEQTEAQRILNETWEKFPNSSYETNNELRTARDNLENVTGMIVANDAAISELEESYLSSSGKVRLASDAVKAYIESNSEMASVLSESGLSVDDFSSAIADAGITQEQLAKMTPEQLKGIADAWAENADNVKPELEKYKSEVGYTMDESTKKAVAAVGKNIRAGIPVTSGQIELLKKAIEDPIEGTRMSVDESSRMAVESIVANMEAGVPLTAEQAMTLKRALEGGVADLPKTYADKSLEAMTAINGNVMGSTPLILDSVLNLESGMVTALNPLTGEFESISIAAVQTAEGTIKQGDPRFAAAVGRMKDNGTGTLQLIEGEWRLVGENATSNLGGGMSDNQWKVDGAVDDAKSKTDDLQNAGAGSYGWGSHVIGNFAAGISNGVGGVLANALNAASSKVKAILGHTVPQEGAMRNGGKGEEEWGEHSVQNFAAGIRKQMPNLEATMNEIAAITANGYSALSPSAVRSAARVRANGPSQPGVTVTVEQPASTRSETNYYVTVDAHDLAGANAVGDVIRVFERAKRANPTRTRR